MSYDPACCWADSLRALLPGGWSVWAGPGHIARVRSPDVSLEVPYYSNKHPEEVARAMLADGLIPRIAEDALPPGEPPRTRPVTLWVLRRPEMKATA